MIIAIVSYKPDRELGGPQLKQMFNAVVPMFSSIPGLQIKYFGFDELANEGRSVYIWDSLEAAQACYGSEGFQQSFRKSFGCEPSIEYFDIKQVVDNRSHSA